MLGSFIVGALVGSVLGAEVRDDRVGVLLGLLDAGCSVGVEVFGKFEGCARI